MPEIIPRRAEVVVIGAGAVGTSIAYHLAQRGCTDGVVLERNRIAQGASGDGAGGFRQQCSTAVNVQMTQLSLPYFLEARERLGLDEEGLSGLDKHLDPGWAEHSADLAYRRVPTFASARVVGGWSGFYTMSPDAHGLIGALPEPRGFSCATGFSGHGFQHSPATGLLLSENILDGKSTTLGIHALRPTRFAEGEPIVEKYVV
ncbi:MAG: FAD-dependent oxidoreductase [Thermomicrobiales bacterium]